MKMETRPRRQPGANLGVFMCGVIVHDEVNAELLGHVVIYMLEKVHELLMAVPRLALCEHPAVGDVERCKQCGCAVPDITVGDALDIAEPKRQNWLGTFECLNLALFVDAENHRMIRRIEVEPNNVLYLVDK